MRIPFTTLVGTIYFENIKGQDIFYINQQIEAELSGWSEQIKNLIEAKAE